MTQRSIILASSSIYRKELLERLNLKFTCVSPDIDETQLKNENIVDLVKRLALEKAKAVANMGEQGLIIASDQALACNKQILGKPGNIKNAIKQLTMMSSQTITFQTSLCVYDTKTQEYQLDVIPFTVYMRKLTEQEIARYLETEQPFNCAGSFKSEGLGITLFEKMEGEDPNALIGLPLIRLCEFLRQLGIELP